MKHLANGARTVTHGSPGVRSISLAITVLALAVSAGHLTAYASITPINELTGGGARWIVTNTAGANNALPVGGECDDSPGFGIGDAALPDADQLDAFDYGATIWVNDSIFAAPEPLSFEPQSITAGPVLMSGLNTSIQYYALPGAPVLRTLASFENPSDSAITATITLATNIGSGSSTEVTATSSDDVNFTTEDRWVITDDTGFNPTAASKLGTLAIDDNDPALTHVLFGPGAPSVTPATVSQTVFECAGTEGILATYSLTVPAGATRSLLFFNGLHETSATAATAAEVFNSTSAPDSALLAGLTETQLAQVANWQFAEGVELTSFLATGNGSFSIGSSRRSFVVTARRDSRHRLRGSVSYTEFGAGLQFRSTRITGAQSLGARGVRLRGVGHINRSGPFTFTADLVDNPGSNADTFGLAVSNGLVVPATVVQPGSIRVRTPRVNQGGPLPVSAGG